MGLVREKKTYSIVDLAFFLVLINAFLMPFGNWQEFLLAGATAPQLTIPLAFFLVFVSSLNSLKVSNISFLLFLLIFSITPSLIIGKDSFSNVYINFIGYLVLFILIPSVTITLHKIKLLISFFYYGLIFISLCSIISVLTSFDVGNLFGNNMVLNVFGLKRLIGTESNPNAFSFYYVAAIPISYFFYLSSSVKRNKIFHLLICALFLICLFLTVSRGALMGTIMSMMFMLAYQKNSVIKRWKFFLTIPLLGIGAFILPTLVIENAGLLYDIAEGDPTKLVRDKNLSTQYKFDVLLPYLEIFTKNIFFGVGYGNLGDAAAPFNIEQKSAHNIFLGIGLEFGLFSLILFILILLGVFFNMRRICLYEKGGSLKLMSSLILGIFVGMVANGLVHEIYINFMFWFFLSISLAVYRLFVIKP